MILKEIFKRKNDIISSDLMNIRKFFKNSFLENNVVYLKEIGVNAKTMNTIATLVSKTC